MPLGQGVLDFTGILGAIAESGYASWLMVELDSSTGLWSISRHPNYLGEILLWLGMAVIALPVLAGWQWVGLLSPLFVAVLLTRVSGIPLLEAKADARWGGQPEYERYKARTPVLVPRPGRQVSG